MLPQQARIHSCLWKTLNGLDGGGCLTSTATPRLPTRTKGRYPSPPLRPCMARPPRRRLPPVLRLRLRAVSSSCDITAAPASPTSTNSWKTKIFGMTMPAMNALSLHLLAYYPLRLSPLRPTSTPPPRSGQTRPPRLSLSPRWIALLTTATVLTLTLMLPPPLKPPHTHCPPSTAKAQSAYTSRSLTYLRLALFSAGSASALAFYPHCI